MDILNSIRSKLKSLNYINELPGTKAVLTHIDVAERYYEQAKSNNDEHLFTDVIYRCNHAFEGILKEAFTHFEGKDASTKTPNEIEKFLISNEILKGRVLDLLTNYRQNWRNPSTHDYKLFFSEQEVFLAIVTVSAFINILLDQVIQRVSYQTEKKEFEGKSKKIKDSIENYLNLGFTSKLLELTRRFAIEVISGDIKSSNLSESQLIGTLSGFISSAEPEFNIIFEPSFKHDDSVLRPDLIIEYQGERVLFEIKRAGGRKRRNFKAIDQAALEQVKTYQIITGIKEAILFFYPHESDDLILTSVDLHGDKDKPSTIFQISPGEIDVNN
jgi:hypothetical protein